MTVKMATPNPALDPFGSQRQAHSVDDKVKDIALAPVLSWAEVIERKVYGSLPRHAAAKNWQYHFQTAPLKIAAQDLAKNHGRTTPLCAFFAALGFCFSFLFTCGRLVKTLDTPIVVSQLDFSTSIGSTLAAYWLVFFGLWITMLFQRVLKSRCAQGELHVTSPSLPNRILLAQVKSSLKHDVHRIDQGNPSLVLPNDTSLPERYLGNLFPGDWISLLDHVKLVLKEEVVSVDESTPSNSRSRRNSPACRNSLPRNNSRSHRKSSPISRDDDGYWRKESKLDSPTRWGQGFDVPKFAPLGLDGTEDNNGEQWGGNTQAGTKQKSYYRLNYSVVIDHRKSANLMENIEKSHPNDHLVNKPFGEVIHYPEPEPQMDPRTGKVIAQPARAINPKLAAAMKLKTYQPCDEIRTQVVFIEHNSQPSTVSFNVIIPAAQCPPSMDPQIVGKELTVGFTCLASNMALDPSLNTVFSTADDGSEHCAVPTSEIPLIVRLTKGHKFNEIKDSIRRIDFIIDNSNGQIKQHNLLNDHVWTGPAKRAIDAMSHGRYARAIQPRVLDSIGQSPHS
jgi:hypothetical protein